MRIALTGSGTATSTGFMKALRMAHADSIELLGFDMNPMNSCMLFADLSIKVPRSDDPGYPSYLADMCSRLQIDLLLPILDQEFMILKGQAHLFEDGQLFMPGYSWRLTDKLECDAVIRNASCAGPEIHVAPNGERLIWKPRVGAGARGVREVRKPEDLPANADDGLLFDFIDGQEYTVDFIAFEGHYCCGAQRKRLMTRGGVCTTAYVEPLAEDVQQQLEKIISSIGYEGPGCFQFIRDHGGKIFWTDLNPRVGGGTMLTVQAGLNIPAMFLDMLLTGTPPPRVEVMPCHAIRYFEEFTQ